MTISIPHKLAPPTGADFDLFKPRYPQTLPTKVPEGPFFSIIAHDLRSSFNGFMGLTQIMAEEFSSLTMDEMQHLAECMRNSAANLFRLLEDLLQWAIMQQGLIPFNPEEVRLLHVTDQCIGMVRELACSRGIDLICDIPGDLTVWADSHMLQTVIRNLLSNAMKFTSKNGTIALSAAAADHGVEVAVRDSGIGMNHEIINHLFQIDGKNKRTGLDGEPGVGFGLLLCKEFVEKHGGEIRVESEEGRGSGFYFTMPYKPEMKIPTAADDAVTAADKEPAIRPLKILIAEDDEQSEILIAITVKKFGREIIKAANGIEAVEACRDNPDLDLILLDLGMPEMDGYEAARQIRLFNKQAIIIAQTAFTITGERERALAAGCNDYIEKPINKDRLAMLLKKYF